MTKKQPRPRSGIGILGAFLVAIGLFMIFFLQMSYWGGGLAGLGFTLFVLSTFLDRLDDILDELRAINEKLDKK